MSCHNYLFVDIRGMDSQSPPSPTCSALCGTYAMIAMRLRKDASWPFPALNMDILYHSLPYYATN